MRIVVCLHAAPPRGKPLADNDVEAIRMARALAGDHEIIALLAGTKEEAAPLEAARAAGIARAARIDGESFAASDFHTLGQVLGSAARTLEADLILIGAHADTEGLGALSASVARHMNVPHLANIESLDALEGAPLSLAVTVRGGGHKRRLGVGVPIVMSVARGSGVVAEAAVAEAAAEPAAAAASAGDARTTIETLALFDPEVTVIRRRTEILGSSAKAERGTRAVASASELMAALTRRGPPP